MLASNFKQYNYDNEPNKRSVFYMVSGVLKKQKKVA